MVVLAKTKTSIIRVKEKLRKVLVLACMYVEWHLFGLVYDNAVMGPRVE